MLQRKPTKRETRKAKRIQLLLVFLIIIVSGVNLILLYKVVTFKKVFYVSPVSSIGFFKNNDFEEKLKKSGVEYENLKISEDTYTFNVLEQGMVTMTGSKNIDQQISSLQLILKNLKIKGTRFKSLDFRYDKPVIIGI